MEIEATGAEAVETPVIGAESTEQSTEQSVESTEQAQESTEQQEIDGEQSQEGNEQVVAGPDKFKGLIESLKKTDPALAKEVKNLVFAADALKKEFPGGLAELRQMKTTLDDLGGAEGIETLKAEKQEWSQIDDQFANGDPKVLETFAKFNPEGFAKLVPGAIDMLAQTDKAAYDHALSGIFVATLDSWKFADVLDRVYEELAQYKDDKGQFQLAGPMQRLQSLFKQYETVRELAAKAPQRKAEGEDQKLAQERSQLAQERAQLAATHVAQQTNAYADKKISDFLTQEARIQKFNLDGLKKVDLGEGKTAYSKFSAEINEEIGRLVAQDKAFVKKVQDSIAAGRRDEAVKLSNNKFDQVYQIAVRRVVKLWASTFNPKSTAKANGGNGQAVTTPGVKKLEAAPELHLVDQKDPNWRQNFMLGKAKLKTGQRVEW